MLTGQALVIGARCGQHGIVAKRLSSEEIARLPRPAAVYSVGLNAHIVFGTATCSAEKSMEFLTTTPGARFETNMHPSLDVGFRDVAGAELESVVTVLNNFHTLTKSIILSFDRR